MPGERLKGYPSGIAIGEKGLWDILPVDAENLAKKEPSLEKRVDNTVLWHQRLGHMSQKNMDLLVKRGFLDRKKVSTFSIFEDCIYGRAKRVSFDLAQHDTKEEKLDYVHSDLWGAPTVPLSL
uniref:Uncharacterized protein At2g07693 n=1 Tax=Arabidopsis thaliana TaxID=3702 RepID=Q8S892_ARATH|nr:hypothetical protein [Arabidopsis thaliana]